MQVMRIMPLGTPLWPIYRRIGRWGLTKTDGNTICTGCTYQIGPISGAARELPFRGVCCSTGFHLFENQAENSSPNTTIIPFIPATKSILQTFEIGISGGVIWDCNYDLMGCGKV